MTLVKPTSLDCLHTTVILILVSYVLLLLWPGTFWMTLEALPARPTWSPLPTATTYNNKQTTISYHLPAPDGVLLPMVVGIADDSVDYSWCLRGRRLIL